MFKFFKEKKEKKAREKHTYDLEIDNLAVPEIHTHKPETEKKRIPGRRAAICHL